MENGMMFPETTKEWFDFMYESYLLTCPADPTKADVVNAGLFAGDMADRLPISI